MFLKKVVGPRVVILPDGRAMSRADLPEGNNLRWTPQRKRLVAEAVQAGLITCEQAMCDYELSAFELDAWCKRYCLAGTKRAATGNARALGRRENQAGLTMG
jgi:hypothetical protein